MMQAYKNKWLPLSALALGMALSFGANAEEQKSVAVTAIVEHPALDAARDGVKEAPPRRPATKTARTSSGSTRAPRATPAPPRRSPASSSATSPT